MTGLSSIKGDTDFEASWSPVRNRILHSSGHDHTVRWRDGERLDHLYEEQCDRMRETGRGDHLAVDAAGLTLTYRQLDERANQFARYLLSKGAGPGDRIGLLFDNAPHAYISMLAVLKINAAYLPLDAGFPADRVGHILADAEVRLVLSLSHLRDRLPEVDSATFLCVDDAVTLITTHDVGRLTDAEKGKPVDDLCYLIYTSGSTGRPKGVAIQHDSICNFVRVAAEVYGIEQADRVYQGLTIAFDFSVEEIWVPWASGATIVPKPDGASLLGQELWDFLHAREITALCCVPTLLASLDEDLPGLRFLLLSGEACPQNLVTRWYRPGRRFLNVYGPTETTVTATWTSLHPDRPVTLGVPLPTYSAAILDPVENRALPFGEMGEIGIAGVGLATGYLNRDDLTEQVFIDDFIGIPNNPSGRIYRTGDLGRINDDGEIEYHGRIDTQVKIRGYRIELTEIESVLLRVPEIAQAVVDTYEPAPGVVELVAYYSLRDDTAGLDRRLLDRQLRERLPGYMVPAYFEELPVIPMTTSDKADRKNLPAPRGQRGLATQHDYIAPETDLERILAEALGEVMGLPHASADSDFFRDLGADSLLMAKFCALLRKQANLPAVSMKDVYLYPTVTGLAAALTEAAAATPTPPEPPTEVVTASTPRYVLCGALQMVLFLGYACLDVSVLSFGFDWISASTGPLDAYARAVAFGTASFLVLCTLPIVAKWILIGRWKPQEIPIWSLAYVRFWLVKFLIRSNPLVLFIGSPLYVLYLRALGARIGRRVAIFSRDVPVCADLLAIGDDTVIRKDSHFNCYRAHAGLIQIGGVTIGKNVVVSEATVLEIGTSMGDGAQLGHASCLPAYQSVPDGQRWHGSPAQRTEVDYRAVEGVDCGTAKRVLYSVGQLLTLFLFTVPLGIALVNGAFAVLTLPGTANLGSWRFYLDHAVQSLILFLGAVLAGLAVVVTVPRLLNLALTPDKTYPLYGFHYSIQRTIARITNLGVFTYFFGDSSYIVYYLRAIGYNLSKVEQTGSNFGVEVKHETPFLSYVGRGTMVSDRLSIANVEFSSTSFRVTKAELGAHNFVGNNIVLPSRAKIGDNCLLATKVAVPIGGPVREDVGLLGSPCFEIPRTVERDQKFDHLRSGPERRRLLAAKNRHNTVTLLAYLLMQWLHLVGLTMLGQLAAELYASYGSSVIVADVIVTLVFGIGYFVLVERIATGFRALRPQFCSIYDRYFWQHERFWKLRLGTTYLQIFNGTPFKNLLWRLMGVRIGHRVFDDGCAMPEKTLVTIGSDCTLNTGSVIQCHSLEDGAFKSDHITLGAGCTVGTNAFVHYGVTMSAGTVLEADSFLMKGEETTPHTRWQGNPAKEVPGGKAAPAPVEVGAHVLEVASAANGAPQ